MGIYKTTKCGFCDIKWEFLKPSLDDRLGPPIIKCQSCNTLNKTKSKLFRDLTQKEQKMIKFKNDKLFFLINTFLIVISILLGWILLGIEVEDRSLMGTLIVLSVPGLILFGSIKRIEEHESLDEIVSKIENEYDKNGGFIWSNQWYRD